MKANSSKSNLTGVLEKINRKIKELNLEMLARQSGFQRRKAKKITAENFLNGFFLMMFSKGKNSFEAWASRIGLLIKQSVSKQSVWLKMTKEELKFLELVLSEAIKRTLGLQITPRLKQVAHNKVSGGSVFERFNDIVLEDSVCQKLKPTLKQDYPGSVNQQGATSILRIDTIYSLKRGIFKHFKLTNFRDVDYKHSMDIFDYLSKGDLIIRDLGYFVLDCFKRMTETGMYFISRIKFSVKVYDSLTEEGIDLLKILKGSDFLDKSLLLGEKKKLPIRLIAIRLDDKTVNERRRKARADKKHKYTEEYLELLEYAIFITNCPSDMLTIKDVIQLYRLRWRIEVIFKSWKSYLSLGDVKECAQKIKLNSYVYCRLIYIVLFMVNLYNYLEQFSDKISLLKFSNYLVSNFAMIFLGFNDIDMDEHITKQIQKYCCYDKRKRINFNQQLFSLI